MMFGNKFGVLFKASSFFLIWILFVSCSNEDKTSESGQEKVFFDLKGFVEQQIDVLNRTKPSVVKNVAMGQARNQLKTKDIDWAKELELFIQADLNKPALKQSYTIQRPDSLTYLYISKEKDRLPVQELKIVLDSPSGLPIQINATLKSENKLYSSAKVLEMYSEKQLDGIHIKKYKISGFQKLAFMDAKPFEVEVTLEK